MKRRPWLVAIVIAAGACVVLIVAYLRSAKELSTARAELARYRNAVATLEKRAHDAQSERDSANRTSRELRGEVAALQQQRKGDSLVIETLWRELRPGIRGTDKPVRYDWETVKKLAAYSGDNPADIIGQIVTSEGIAATLGEHSGDPTYWVAAASLVQDNDATLKYLEEAVRLYPKSAVVLSSLVEALMARGQFDETTMGHIAQLKEVDPANSLPDYYDAHCRFQTGDIRGALKCLAEGSVKDRFADNAMDLLMARYNYLLNEGCSDPIAMGLAAFTLPVPHMAMLRGVARCSVEQAQASVSTGQYEEALRIADSVLRTGRNLSSSGRFLIYDLVGIALQESALNEQKRIYEGLGNASRLGEIDAQLRAIKDRSSLIRAMAGSFGDIFQNMFQNMSEEDIAKYVESTIRSGEFSTLRDMPGVAKVLERARNQEQ